MNRAVPIALLAIPLWVVTLGQIRNAHYEAFMVGVLLLLAWQARNWWVRSFSVYVGAWMLGSLVVSASAPHASNLYLHKEAVKLVMWTAFAIAVYLAAQRATVRGVALAVIVLAALQLVVVGLQSIGADPVMGVLKAISNYFARRPELGDGRMGGTMGNPNFVSALIALALPCLALFASRWVLAAAFCGIAAFCWTQSTSTAIFAAWAGLAVVAVYGNDRVLMVACAGLLLAGLAIFFFTDDGIKEITGPRVTTWKATLAAWWDQNTLIGNGPGTWRPWWLGQLSASHWWHWKYAHNEYVQVAFELGLIGLGLVLSLLASLFGRAWKLRKSPEVVALAGIVAALAVSCAGNFSMHLAPLAMVGLCAMGLLEAKEWQS